MKKIAFVFVLLLQTAVFGQNQNYEKIAEAFEVYSELPREIVFVHLNKSTYIKGEQIGFKAYVFDKDNKKPSIETKNLYCTLVDDNGEIVKKQLIMVNQGVGSGIMELDSLITANTYRFRAYTNWMRNFSEPNYFEQEIRVLDPEKGEPNPPTNTPDTVDAQFLPEGGHAVAGLEAVYGAIIKDQNGLGIPFLQATVVNEQDKFVTNFKVNAMGIGRFAIQTSPGTRYFVKFSHKEKAYRLPLETMEAEGIVIKLQDLRNKLGLIFNAKFKDNRHLDVPYLLTFHDGNSLKSLELSFNGNNESIVILPKEDLYKGMNTFTLFNPEGKPILERLYFNRGGVTIHSDLEHLLSRDADSLLVTLDLPDVSAEKWNSLSVSVLPGNTISYGSQENLPSYHLLKPYVKGLVENAAYYFRGNSPKKAFELDNLLITQGWSSYDWNAIFTKPPKYLFDFEKGLSFKVTLNTKEESQFYIFPTQYYPLQLLELDAEKFEFSSDLFFPLENETLRISEMGKDGKLSPPKIFVQFKPSAVPELKSNTVAVFPNKPAGQDSDLNSSMISFQNLEKMQQLDEVLLIQDRTNTRLERLRNSSQGKVDLFTESDPRRSQFLGNYLNSRGYVVNESAGIFSIVARNPNSPNNARPNIYLDGVLLVDFSILYRYQMDIVDYIEINPSGVGGGLMGGGGIIKIVTNPFLRQERELGEFYKNYDIPLSFSAKKRFYNPAYSSYSNAFFFKYGTIDWQSDISLTKEGEITFKIKDYGVSDIKLYLEGVVNESEYVSDIIELRLD
ncbi:MAG: hypothetical protein KJN96_00380 [Eudoraea sp.]|nr:hypothetical protein [Eudoraea sp.]